MGDKDMQLVDACNSIMRSLGNIPIPCPMSKSQNKVGFSTFESHGMLLLPKVLDNIAQRLFFAYNSRP